MKKGGTTLQIPILHSEVFSLATVLYSMQNHGGLNIVWIECKQFDLGLDRVVTAGVP